MEREASEPLQRSEDVCLNPTVAGRLSEEQLAVNDLLRSTREGGSGHVPDKKPPHVVRLYSENTNSLSLYDEARSWKSRRIRDTTKRMQVDGIFLQETGVDFRQVPEESNFEAILDASDCRVTSANNITEESSRYQHGGVAAVSLPRLASFIIGQGKDPTGLGRWSWFRVGNAERSTVIITVYRPVKPGRSSRNNGKHGWYTVWAQQRRYFRKKGLRGSPRSRFLSDLVEQLTQWRRSGNDIILLGDLNECVYNGSVAKRLAEDDILMGEAFKSVNGHDAPASHYRGQLPITGCFITPGVDCLNVYVSPHRAGAGDHRYWIIDICARSLLGVDYPHLVRPRGRRLKCCVERTVRKYNKKLRRLTAEHNMYTKMDKLLTSADTAPPSELSVGMNRWDKEHTDHQISAESDCNTFKCDDIEFSPETGLWLNRLALYRQLVSINKRRRKGKRADTSHFLRGCDSNGIDDPLALTDEEVQSCISACEQRLEELAPVASMLREEHLRDCYVKAKQAGRVGKAKRILNQMRNEKQRKRWKGVRRSTTPRSGGAPTRIIVNQQGNDIVYDTREGVEEQAARRLTDRFKLARDAPISQGQLFDDIGYLGDTSSTRAILEGTYDFPPEMDPHTRLLLEEAHRIFANKSTEEISNFVSTSDFQYFWKRADEFIQSSYSNVHFGHYKAIARDRYLSALQAAKLSLAAKTGIPMDRWGHSLTVLLEKEFGNIYLDKLRAICLMEADFNWMNKLVFAKRMMDQAHDAGLVAPDQFAKRATQASFGVLCKVLFCDIVRALHVVAGIPSVDLGNCYDAVSHPIASIAMQALKVPLTTVVLSLSVLQTMTFYLRTGYGVSQQGYGGTANDPTFGLGQGNGMAPSVFSSVSSLMVESYKRLGHASTFTGAWSGFIFILAAILYVDDTDLLIIGKKLDMSLDEFFAQTQEAVLDWGKIVQATGGYLKAKKCFWYMLAWNWHKGVPTLRSLRSLPKYRLMIPQKDGSQAQIPLRDVNDSEKTLGVYSCPSGDFSYHIERKMDDGKKWIARLRSHRCPPADGWMGFRYALMPKLTYGFAAITPDLDTLEKSFQDLYYDVLSPLRVNQNITKYFRMAPKRFQGLGMPNPGIVMLSQKLHLLQTQWDQPTTTGRLLHQALETFQMEMGLSTDIFAEDFDRIGHLATGGFWKHLWQLCTRYKVKLQLSRRWLIPLLRSGDRTIMDIVCSQDIYTSAQKASINRVRRHKGLHCLGDITLCDGRTIDQSIFNKDRSDSSRVFSTEKPTSQDFKLFRRAIRIISSDSFLLPTSLGPYISQPHRPDIWFTTGDRSELFRFRSNRCYDLFIPDVTARRTRHGTRYLKLRTVNGLCPRSIRASVFAGNPNNAEEVVLHSTAAVYKPSRSRQSFIEKIQSLPNQSLWRTLEIDGDGSWIYRGLLNNTLAMGSDGSYNEALASDVCSSASVIHCRETGSTAKVTWVEKSDAHTADNYRAEILGAVALQILVRTAIDGKYVNMDMCPRFGCDNKTVVHHGNHPHRPMPEKQSQADVLRYFKKIVRDSPCKIKLYHVYGHLDELLPLSELTVEERINVECDHLADAALLQGLESGIYIDRVLPDEDLVMIVDGSKIAGATTTAIYRSWGREVARDHFNTKHIIREDLFDEVDWNSIEKVSKSVPEMYSVWLTKHVSGFCGTNHMLNTIYGDVIDQCPNCGIHPERARHIAYCPDSGRTATYQMSVQTLIEWLDSQQTDPILTLLIRQYLLARGTATMTSFCPTTSAYYVLAEHQDALGFHNFIEGRISRLFRPARQWDITQRRLRRHAPNWCSGLVLRLTQIVHRQWTYRNRTVHYKGADGLTVSQQLRIMRECEHLLYTDPSTLLPADRGLLDIDFRELGSGPAIARQTWRSEMQAAIGASRMDDNHDASTPALEVPVDTEGSIRFRRRRRKSRRQLS